MVGEGRGGEEFGVEQVDVRDSGRAVAKGGRCGTAQDSGDDKEERRGRMSMEWVVGGRGLWVKFAGWFNVTSVAKKFLSECATVKKSLSPGGDGIGVQGDDPGEIERVRGREPWVAGVAGENVAAQFEVGEAAGLDKKSAREVDGVAAENDPAVERGGALGSVDD